MEQEIIQSVEFLARLTIPGVIGMVFVLLYKAGFLQAIASRFKKADTEVAQEFREFKEVAEGNHYTDLESLKEWRRSMEVWKNNIDERLNKMSEDVAWIRGKIGNGHSR